jgi:hypothetical protein
MAVKVFITRGSRWGDYLIQYRTGFDDEQLAALKDVMERYRRALSGARTAARQGDIAGYVRHQTATHQARGEASLLDVPNADYLLDCLDARDAE